MNNKEYLHLNKKILQLGILAVSVGTPTFKKFKDEFEESSDKR